MRNNRVIRWYEPSKYGNEKTEVDGIVFDSKKEANRYRELKLLEKAGEISDLKLQVPYELIPNQYIGKACVERKLVYVADFEYTDKNPKGELGTEVVVEDVKGHRTKEYIIKRKLMLWVYGIRIREI